MGRWLTPDGTWPQDLLLRHGWSNSIGHLVRKEAPMAGLCGIPVDADVNTTHFQTCPECLHLTGLWQDDG